MRFRKKPIEVEAVHYLGDGNMDGGVPPWLWHALSEGKAEATNGADPFVIHTLEGDHIASPGDWIIRGVKGELYPCKPDIFELTYEAVEDATPKPPRRALAPNEEAEVARLRKVATAAEAIHKYLAFDPVGCCGVPHGFWRDVNALRDAVDAWHRRKL